MRHTIPFCAKSIKDWILARQNTAAGHLCFMSQKWRFCFLFRLGEHIGISSRSYLAYPGSYPPMRSRRSEFSWYAYEAPCSQLSFRVVEAPIKTHFQPPRVPVASWSPRLRANGAPLETRAPGAGWGPRSRASGPPGVSRVPVQRAP